MDDPPDAIPPDVLDGFCRQVGDLQANHPERIPAYLQRTLTMIEDLQRSGRDAETPRFAAFIALLDVAATS